MQTRDRLLYHLNFVFEHAPEGLESLIEHRVPITSMEVVNHPLIVVMQEASEGGEASYGLGMLGFLNSMLDPEDRIVAEYDDDSGALLGFK